MNLTQPASEPCVPLTVSRLSEKGRLWHALMAAGVCYHNFEDGPFTPIWSGSKRIWFHETSDTENNTLAEAMEAYLRKFPVHDLQDDARVVLRCPGDGCQGCPGCAAPANSSSDVPVVPRADPIPTSWLDPLLTGPNAVIGKPPYGCDDIETLLTAIRERIRVSAPEGPRHEPICTCGSDCVPGPAHLPGCPSRDSPEEPRHAASCLSWRKLPCNCRDEPPKEREL